MKRISLAIILLIGIIAFMNVEMQEKEQDTKQVELEKVSGKVVYETENQEANREDITIQEKELKKCCIFLDEKGNQRTCYAMKNFECDYCAQVC
jgi:hypothetical protein